MEFIFAECFTAGYLQACRDHYLDLPDFAILLKIVCDYLGRDADGDGYDDSKMVQDIIREKMNEYQGIGR